jgi:hypothetical protein
MENVIYRRRPIHFYYLNNPERWVRNCMIQLRYKIYNYRTYDYRPDPWVGHFFFLEDALRGGVSSFFGLPGDLKKFVIAGC